MGLELAAREANTAHMPEPAPPRSAKRQLAITLGAVAVVAAVIAAVALGSGGGPTESSPPAYTQIYVVSDPPGATVTRTDGGVFGNAPITLELPRSETDFPVIVRHEGYKDRHVTVPVFALSGRIDVKLTRLGEDEPPPPRRIPRDGGP